MKFRVFKIFSLIACVLLIGACGKTEATGKDVYCTSVAFVEDSVTMYVGDTLTIEDNDIVIKPSNCTFGYNLSVEGDAVTLSNKVVTAVSVGTATLKVSVKADKISYTFDTITIEVLKKPVYVSTCAPTHLTMTMEKGSTAVNTLIYNNDTDFVPTVRYSTDGVVTYNVSTGVVSAVGNGTVTVFIDYQTGADTYETTSFDVTVHTYISEFVLTGGSDVITMYEGSTGVFEYSHEPTSATVLPVFNGSSILEISTTGTYRALQCGTTKFSVSYITTGGVTHVKEYNVNIIPKPTTLSATLSSNIGYAKQNIDFDFTNTLTISADTNFNANDLTKVALSSASLTKITEVTRYLSNGDIVIEFTYNQAGNVSFDVSYSCITFNENLVLNATSEQVTVYDVISEMYANSTKLNGSTINLNMCNEGEHYNTADLSVVYAEVSTSRGHTFEVANKGVATFDGTTVTAVGVGSTTITFTSVDGYHAPVVVNIVVTQCLAQNITVSCAETLYVGGVSTYFPNTTTITTTLTPACSVDNVEVKLSNDNLTYDNGVLTAVKEGSCVVTVSATNCQKEITVNILLAPNQLNVSYNDEIVNNQAIRVATNENIVVSYSFAYNGTPVSYNGTINVTTSADVTINYGVNYFMIESTTELNAEFVVTCNGITATFSANFVNNVYNPTEEIVASDLVLNYYDYLQGADYKVEYTLVPSEYNIDQVTLNCDSDYLTLEGTSIKLNDKCLQITTFVNATISISAGSVNKVVNVKIYNFAPISTLSDISTLVSSRATGSYGLTDDIDVSSLNTINNMTFVLVGNGHKLIGLNKTFATTIAVGGGLCEVTFNNISYTTSNPTDYSDDNANFTAVNCDILICAHNLGEIVDVTLNGNYGSDSAPLNTAVVIAINDGVVNGLNVNLNIHANAFRGVFHELLADSTTQNITMTSVVNVYGTTVALISYYNNATISNVTTNNTIYANGSKLIVYLFGNSNNGEVLSTDFNTHIYHDDAITPTVTFARSNNDTTKYGNVTYN